MNYLIRSAKSCLFLSVSMVVRVASLQMARSCVVCSLLLFLSFAAGKVWANGTQDYFDVNGSTAGFGTPTVSGTYDLSGSFWTSSSAGTTTTGPFSDSSQLTFGKAASDFPASTFIVNADTTHLMAGLAISSSSANITLSGTGNLNLSVSQTWSVAAGSTLNESATYQGIGLNFNSQPLTLTGGGTINFNTPLGYNDTAATGSVTQNGSGLVVNLNSAGDTTLPYTGGYNLTQGVLNFASTASANTFQSFSAGAFVISGGTLDNTSGGNMTLAVGNSGSVLGGNFTFKGSNNLDLGAAPVAMPVNSQITVVANTLEIDGAISGNGSLSKLGAGLLVLTGSNSYTGNTSVSAGTIQLPSGQLPAANEFVSGSGTANLVQSGGLNAISGNLTLGNLSGETGIYTLGGNGLLSLLSVGNQQELIGISGTGAFTQTGGTNTVSQMLLGESSGGKGTYNLSGSGLLATASEYIGGIGSGSFIQTGGSNQLGFQLYVGYFGNSNGAYALSGGQLSSAFSEVIGASGTGSFTQSGGTNTASSGLSLAQNGGVAGTYNLNGGLLTLTGLTQGSGSAAFNFSSGSFQAGSSFSTNMPMSLSASGGGPIFDTQGNTLTLNGVLSGTGGFQKIGSGTLLLTAPNTYSGTTLAASGTLLVANSNALAGSTFDSSGSGALSFGTLTAANLGGLQGSGNLTLGNTAAAAVALNVGSNNAATTFSGVLGGNGSLAQSGSGALTLSNYNTYTGGTIVNGGTLTLNAGGTSGTILGALTINPGASVKLNAVDALGYTNTLSSINVSGATIDNTTAGENGYATNFTLSGGTMSSSGGGNYDFTNNYGVTTLASSITSLISAGINIRDTNNMVFNVAAGTTANGVDLLVSGAIVSGGATNSITKSGAGMMELAGANTFTGATTISGGTLLLANFNALSGSTFDSTGTGTLSFGALTSASFGGLQGSGDLTLSNSAAAAVALSAGGNNSSTTFSGQLSGNGSLTKLGGGMLTVTAFNFYSGNTTVSAGTVQILSGQLPAANQYVGGSGTASLAQSGGIDAVSGSLYLGNNSIDFGTYNLSGGALSANSEDIGYFGNGSFAQSGGTNSTFGLFFLGYYPGGNGSYNLSGGALSASGGEFVGYSGSGSFTQSGGNHSVNGLLLGYSHGAGGSYYLSGSGTLSASGAEYIGYSGSGSFTQSGGTNSAANLLELGNNSGASGMYSLSGGSLSVSGGEYIGNSGSGGFTQSGGNHSVANDLFIGYSSGAFGIYNLSGGSLFASGGEFIGASGNGSFTQSGGSHSVAGPLYLGFIAMGSGSYNLSGGSLFTSGTEYVGYSSAGNFTQSAGTNSTANGLSLGYYAGGSGWYNLNGGLLSLGGLQKGNGSGTFNFSGGTFQAASGFATSQPISLGLIGNGPIFDTQANTLELDGVVSGTGSFQKIGSGTLLLTAGNTYTGTTLATAGTLMLGNANAIAGSTFDSSGGGSLSFGTLTNANFGGLQGTGNLSLNNTTPAAVALAVGGNNASTTFSGQLNGGGSLTKLGSGILTVTGSNSFSGDTTVSAGTVKVVSGQLPAANEYVANGGTANLVQIGGANTIAGNLILANYAGDAGTFNLGGGLLSVAGIEYIGNSGSGGFTQSGGTHSVTNALSIANAANSSGSYSLSGGLLSAAGGEQIGSSGAGSFTQSGGTHSVANVLSLASEPNSSGTYNLSSGSLSAAMEQVGVSGSGNFTQSGGTQSVSNGLYLGSNGGSGTYNLNGGLLRLSEFFSGAGNDYFNFGGGAFQAGSSFATSVPVNLGMTGGGPVFDTQANTLELDGVLSGSGGFQKIGSGTLLLTASNSYTGATLVSNGLLQLGNQAAVPDNTALATAGGTLDLGGYTKTTTAAVSFKGGVMQDGTIVDNDANYDAQAGTISAALQGNASLAKTTPRLVVLSGADTYSGGTTISAGTLQVGNGGNSGSIVGNVVNNAVLAFSRSDDYFFTGSISGTGSLVMNGPGTLALQGAISPADITLSQGQITAGPGNVVVGNLAISSGGRFNYTGSSLYLTNLANGGTFIGGGQVSGSFINQSSGSVRIGGGQDLYLSSGGSQSNQGLISVLGTQSSQATFESSGPLINSAGGTSLIAVQNANLFFDGGLTNQGPIAFSYGISNIFGNVTNALGGSITIAGGAGVTFYGDVVQNGALNVASVGSTHSSVVFLGSFSGNFGTTGNGDVFFQGDLRPGDAPAAVSFGGNVYLSPNTNTVIDITGTTPGIDYDQVNVAGNLDLSGKFAVTLSNSAYRPVQGAQFNVLSFASVTGSFASMSGLNLGNRLNLVPALTSNALFLTAVQGGSGSWKTDTSGSISAPNNWAGGVPGEAGDAATFGPVITAPRTVTVDEPTTLGSLVFQTTSSYTLVGSNAIALNEPSGGPQISVLAGSQMISAPLTLEGNLLVSSTSGASLDVSGDISGAASLTLDGGGQLILSGADTYLGGTAVEGGSLVLASNSALPGGSSLSVGAGAKLIFDSSMVGSPIESAAVIVAVPEPGTLALLIAATALFALYRKRRYV